MREGPATRQDEGKWHEALRARVSAGRLAHCERTASLCRAWVEAHPESGLDADQAALGGLLHDFGRAITDPETMLEEAQRFGIPVSDAAYAAPLALLHAPVGRAMLQTLGGLEDEILLAVAYHTVGHGGMTPLQALIYTADYCEPGRTHVGAVEVRAILFQDLRRAAKDATARTLTHLLASGRLIDDMAVKTWNDLCKDGEAWRY